ncbi:MAG TPA: hypothetical protein VKV96_08465, partial [Roseiarcus sp.]|nr:hypothetical protein [Roseiarcus sp.]
TSFVIVSEMTNDHAMIIPLMAAALIANGASKILSKDGVYHALAKNFLAAPSGPVLRLDPPAGGAGALANSASQ